MGTGRVTAVLERLVALVALTVVVLSLAVTYLIVRWVLDSARNPDVPSVGDLIEDRDGNEYRVLDVACDLPTHPSDGDTGAWTCSEVEQCTDEAEESACRLVRNGPDDTTWTVETERVVTGEADEFLCLCLEPV